MNFHAFQATKVRHENMEVLAAKIGFDAADDNRPAFAYADDCYININEDGTYHLQLGRAEWVTENLPELEARLYLWCLTECPDAMGISDENHAALCELLDVMSDGDAVRMLLQGNWEPNA